MSRLFSATVEAKFKVRVERLSAETAQNQRKKPNGGIIQSYFMHKKGRNNFETGVSQICRGLDPGHPRHKAVASQSGQLPALLLWPETPAAYA